MGSQKSYGVRQTRCRFSFICHPLLKPNAAALLDCQNLRRTFIELLTFNFQLLSNKKRGSQLRPLLFTQPPQSAIYGQSA
jgi:hypothetical protein